jgi:hypothetical protein
VIHRFVNRTTDLASLPTARSFPQGYETERLSEIQPSPSILDGRTTRVATRSV